MNSLKGKPDYAGEGGSTEMMAFADEICSLFST